LIKAAQKVKVQNTANNAQITSIIEKGGYVTTKKPSKPVNTKEIVSSFLEDILSANHPPGQYNIIDAIPKTLIIKPIWVLFKCIASIIGL
jgi:hypothetical protein